MGMDLCGKAGYFGWNWHGWRGVLELGLRYGWIPGGTEPPVANEGGPWDGRPWGGSYFCNDGQRVTSADAKALADAIERSLPDIPDGDATVHKMEIVGHFPDSRFFRALKPGVEVSFFEIFSGDGKQRLREFIEFCRGGEFAIW